MAHALSCVPESRDTQWQLDTAGVVVDALPRLLMRRGSPGPGGGTSGETVLPVEIIGAGKFPPLQEIIRTVSLDHDSTNLVSAASSSILILSLWQRTDPRAMTLLRTS